MINNLSKKMVKVLKKVKNFFRILQPPKNTQLTVYNPNIEHDETKNTQLTVYNPNIEHDETKNTQLTVYNPNIEHDETKNTQLTVYNPNIEHDETKNTQTGFDPRTEKKRPRVSFRWEKRPKFEVAWLLFDRIQGIDPFKVFKRENNSSTSTKLTILNKFNCYLKNLFKDVNLFTLEKSIDNRVHGKLKNHKTPLKSFRFNILDPFKSAVQSLNIPEIHQQELKWIKSELNQQKQIEDKLVNRKIIDTTCVDIDSEVKPITRPDRLLETKPDSFDTSTFEEIEIDIDSDL